MFNNPMTSDYVRTRISKYPETLQNVFGAVNNLAYDACHTIEGPLGEGYFGGKLPYDYNRLVQATSNSIRDMARNKNALAGLQLHHALTDAALSDSELDKIIVIAQQEALKRIDQSTSADKKTFTEHGHHGRQYIARNTVERVMKEVLPLNP